MIICGIGIGEAENSEMGLSLAKRCLKFSHSKNTPWIGSKLCVESYIPFLKGAVLDWPPAQANMGWFSEIRMVLEDSTKKSQINVCFVLM